MALVAELIVTIAVIAGNAMVSRFPLRGVWHAMIRMSLALLGIAAAVGACSDDDGSGPNGNSNVRVVHVSPDDPNVDILLEDSVVATDVVRHRIRLLRASLGQPQHQDPRGR
jgi:hypothetical protein